MTLDFYKYRTYSLISMVPNNEIVKDYIISKWIQGKKKNNKKWPVQKKAGKREKEMGRRHKNQY